MASTALGDSISDHYRNRVFQNNGFPELIDSLRMEDRTVLDVGCGSGGNAKLMKQRGKTVYAITLSEAEAELMASQVDHIQVGNVETMPLDYPDGFFDAVLISHVLEHLVDPWSALARLRRFLRPGGRVYVALPNICFYQERVKIFLGLFRYGNAGIIDRLHLRFFTFDTAQELVREAGYSIVSAKTIGGVPLWPLRLLFKRQTWLDKAGCSLFPNLFGWHLIIVGERGGA